MSVYDPEVEDKSQVAKLGHHDDLGTHPERREAEVADLEENYRGPSATDHGSHETALDDGNKSADTSDPKNSEAGTKAEAEESDELFGDGGFYKKEDGKVGYKGKMRSLVKNRKAMFGVGGGVLGLFLTVASLMGFLSTFRLDHFLENIDGRTMSRLNATFDRRSDRWIRTYIRLRMTEIGDSGAVNPDADTLFFRADRVDTGNPARDWYRTLRSSDFEEKVFNKNGVYFTSIVDSSGHIRVGKVTTSLDPVITPDLASTYNVHDLDLNNPDQVNSFLNTIDSNDLKKFVNVDLFDSDKAARLGVRDLVNREVPWWKVVKRRHIRKDIQNKVGIREWRFFEKTRDNMDKRKEAIQRKIVKKVFSGNGQISTLIRCILAETPGGCKISPDESDVRTNADAPSTSGADDDVIRGIEGAKDDVGQAAARTAAGDVTEDVVSKTFKNMFYDSLKKVFLSLFGSGPENPLFWWNVAKKLALIDGLFKLNPDGTSKVQAVVKAGRAGQLAATYATYNISRDQIKSGELVGDELGAFFSTTEDFGNSEAWYRISNKEPTSTASAATTDDENLTKEEYCKKDEAEKTTKMFAWWCDKNKPNGGGNATKLTEAYNKTIGWFVGPIADAVNAITSIPGVNWLMNFFTSLIDNTLGRLLDNIFHIIGLDKAIETVMSWVMDRALNFLGLGLMFDGSQAGAANFLTAGSAVQAESTARASGAVRSTPTTLAYSNKLAREVQERRKRDMSIYERYASISNPDSLASAAVFDVSSITTAQSFSSTLGNFGNIFKNIGAIFSTNVFAASSDTTTFTGSTPAVWAGVDTNDIPQVCLDLDPLNNDVYARTNFRDVTDLSLDWPTARDTDAFYKKVYDWVDDDPAKEHLATTIYNCALLDARTMGGIGNLYGYDKDYGLEDATSSSSGSDPAANPNGQLPTGVVGQDQITDILPWLDPGRGCHNSIADRTRQMFQAADADGVHLTGACWRSNAAQIQARIDNGCPDIYTSPASSCRVPTAIPGTSMHERGLAIDFHNCDSHSSPCFIWLSAHAATYGFYNLPSEPWHWSVDGH